MRQEENINVSNVTQQRLIQLAAWLVATVLILLLSGPLSAVDGSTGLSLLDARVGTVFAALLIALVGIPVVAVALFASVTGHRLAGPFIASAALLVTAWRGGPIDGWMFRHALPGSFKGLIGEIIFWQVALLVVMAVVRLFRRPIRYHFPGLALNRHVGLEWSGHDLKQSAGAVVVCSLIAAAIAGLVIRSTESAQVCIGLMFAFGIAGLITQFTFPRADALVVLISPAVVGMFGYGSMMVQFDTQEDLLRAWYTQGPSLFNGLPALGVALPIHYLSAGVVGAIIGIAWAQSLEQVPADEVADE